MLAQGGPVRETVEAWNGELGWGVLVSPELTARVFAHFRHIRDQDPQSVRELKPGADVIFEYHEPGQDGCEYATNWVRET